MPSRATLKTIGDDLRMTRQMMVEEIASVIPAHICPTDEASIVQIIHKSWYRQDYEPLLDDIIEHHRARHFKSELVTGLLGIFVLFCIGMPCIGVASLIQTWGPT